MILCNKCNIVKKKEMMVASKSYSKIGYRKLCKECRNKGLRKKRGFNSGKGFSKEKWRPLEDRFNDRIASKNGCWIWGGTIDKDGYGKMKISGKIYRAHRISYELHKGDIPEGNVVCHKCDNRACVNPEHLFSGTQSDNIHDMINKNRDRIRGEQSGLSKLLERDVVNIFNSTLGLKELSEKYGVHTTTIRHIKIRKTWKHVTEKL